MSFHCYLINIINIMKNNNKQLLIRKHKHKHKHKQEQEQKQKQKLNEN